MVAVRYWLFLFIFQGSVGLDLNNLYSVKLKVSPVLVQIGGSFQLTCTRSSFLIAAWQSSSLATAWERDDKGTVTTTWNNGTCLMKAENYIRFPTSASDVMGRANCTESPERSILIINNVTPEDHGHKWKCKAWPLAESSSVSVVVVVPVKKMLMKEKGLITVIKGVPTRLTCSSSPSRPPPTISWYRQMQGTEQVIDTVPSHTTALDDKGLVTATSWIDLVPEEKDEGLKVYCRGYNVKDKTAVQSDAVIFTVKYSPKISLTIFPRNDVKEGDDVTFNCTASGNPTPVITWERQRGVLKPGTGQSSVLTIVSASVEDMDEYTCIARNGVLPDGKKSTFVLVRAIITRAPEHHDISTQQPNETGTYKETYTDTTYPVNGSQDKETSPNYTPGLIPSTVSAACVLLILGIVLAIYLHKRPGAPPKPDGGHVMVLNRPVSSRENEEYLTPTPLYIYTVDSDVSGSTAPYICMSVVRSPASGSVAEPQIRVFSATKNSGRPLPTPIIADDSRNSHDSGYEEVLPPENIYQTTSEYSIAEPVNETDQARNLRQEPN